MTLELKVEGMSCGHCVRAVTEAIRAKDPGAQVAVDLTARTVRAETSLPREQVTAVIEDEGYRVVS
jgi:copper chaperone